MKVTSPYEASRGRRSPARTRCAPLCCCVRSQLASRAYCRCCALVLDVLCCELMTICCHVIVYERGAHIVPPGEMTVSANLRKTSATIMQKQFKSPCSQNSRCAPRTTHTYMCMYVYVYIYVYICIYIYIYIYRTSYLPGRSSRTERGPSRRSTRSLVGAPLMISLYVYIYIYTHTHIYVSIYIYIYIYIYMYVYIHIHVHTHMYMLARVVKHVQYAEYYFWCSWHARSTCTLT